jgi:hypothetical protein
MGLRVQAKTSLSLQKCLQGEAQHHPRGRHWLSSTGSPSATPVSVTFVQPNDCDMMNLLSLLK